MNRPWFLVVAIAALVAHVSVAVASTGVAVDLGEVNVDDPLLAGQRYALPQMGVSNPGTEPGTYEMKVMPLEGSLLPPSGWIAFDPTGFELGAGETQTVRVMLQLPPDADPGDYEALLAAQISKSDGQGTGVGAAAASQLSFTVGPSSLIEGWILGFWSFMSSNAPWTYLFLGLLLTGSGSLWISRRFSVRIERRD